MRYDPNNPFAKILRGELPCHRIYEDEVTLAFMDIMPQVDGHVIVIPKEPAVTLMDLSPESACACMRTAQTIARAAKQAMAVPAVMLVQVNGAEAGQTVPHVHIHVLPCTSAEALRPHARYRESPEKLQALAERIIAALPSSKGGA